jgi:hypothetical protein
MMIGLVAAAAAGYVLGTKAGRARFEQIRQAGSKLAKNPSVQGAVSRVEDTISSFLGRKTKSADQTTRPDMAYFDADGGPNTPKV